jgi:transcription initiation factor TFIID subunit 2
MSYSQRPYKLAHQVLSINQINFRTRSYIGVTELQIIPQRSDLKTVKLNCRQCKVFQIMVNDLYECVYTYNDPLLEISPAENRQRTLDTFTTSHYEAVASTDPDRSFGEIIIQIPKQLLHYVAEGKTLVFNIEFGVERPSGGVHFVVPEGKPYDLDRGLLL